MSVEIQSISTKVNMVEDSEEMDITLFKAGGEGKIA